MRKTCKICSRRCQGEYCFRHKPRRRISRKPVEKQKTEKQRSVKALKKVLWAILSKYVRLRDSNEKGFGKCITCDNVEYWKFADAGHGIKRKHNSTLFHEKNLGLQCKGCNQIKDGMVDEFKKATDERYGKGTWEELLALSRIPKRFTPWELEDLIVHYTAEVERLLKTKH